MCDLCIWLMNDIKIYAIFTKTLSPLDPSQAPSPSQDPSQSLPYNVDIGAALEDMTPEHQSTVRNFPINPISDSDSYVIDPPMNLQMSAPIDPEGLYQVNIL